MTQPLIEHVSDTARWVAAYRAHESSRPDALFKDELAAQFAGEQGLRIAQRARWVNGNGWPIVARTTLIDEMVMGALAEGCDCVLNLAAGFDARPYRLDLPAATMWIEADLPHVFDEKERAFEGMIARCQLRRIRVDLADAVRRAAVFAEVASSYQRVLVISEGLLPYLVQPAVTSLASDLLAHATFRGWVFDLTSPTSVRALNRTLGRDIANAPLKFAPPTGVAFFEALGFRAREVRSIVREAVRLKRAPWHIRLYARLPEPNPRQLGNAPWAAVIHLERG
jgi:methyltransferase (TIGR00027 family)